MEICGVYGRPRGEGIEWRSVESTVDKGESGNSGDLWSLQETKGRVNIVTV